jgi:hypothetical protein
MPFSSLVACVADVTVPCYRPMTRARKVCWWWFCSGASLVLLTSSAHAEPRPSSEPAPESPAGDAVNAAESEPAPAAASTPEQTHPPPKTAPAPVARKAPQTQAPSAPPTNARVHLFADYPGAWLELRSYVDAGFWQKACSAPCDQEVRVDGMEARVLAPGMTSSNTFRLEPGPGTANIKVSGGSATARTLGLVGLIAGAPLTLGGAVMFGYGEFGDSEALRIAGIATLATGAVMLVASLPLLALGSTTVRDARGKFIAAVFPHAFPPGRDSRRF